MYSYYSDHALDPYPSGTTVMYIPPNSDSVKGIVYSTPDASNGTTKIQEDPKYTVHIQKSEPLILTLQHIYHLALTPPLPPQQNSDDTDVSEWLNCGKKVSYNKYGVWSKFRIDILPSIIYHISEFRNRSTKNDMWGGNLVNFGENWVSVVQYNIILTWWQVSSFLHRK